MARGAAAFRFGEKNMPVNKITDFFVPEILADAIRAAFAGKLALFGSGAAATAFTMPKSGRASVGTTIKVPYFTSLGEFEDLAADGDALTPATQTSSASNATVKHSGKAFELTQWAEWAAAGLDPYQEASRQLVEGFFRRLDKELVAVAGDETGYGSYVQDGTAATISYDAVVDAKMKWGDENDGVALMVVHSKVFGDMLKLKDTTNRPLLTDINEGGLAKFVGIPVMVSDRVTVVAGTPDTYKNLLCKRSSLAAWVNGQPEVLTDKDILTHTQLAAVHMYYAVHRYNPMAGSSKPGVVILKTR